MRLTNGFVIASLLTAGLVGCTAQNVKQDQPVAANEGVMVTVVDCDRFENAFFIEFYPIGMRSKGYSGSFNKAGSSGCKPGERLLRTIQVPQGKYFIGKIGNVNFVDIPESEAVGFSIEAGKLNYIGDMHIESMPAGRANTRVVDLRVFDNEAKVLAQLDTEYPWLKQRYPWVKNLAIDPRTAASGITPQCAAALNNLRNEAISAMMKSMDAQAVNKKDPSPANAAAAETAGKAYLKILNSSVNPSLPECQSPPK